MKHFFTSKKLIAGIAASAIVISLSGAAFAYWTTTGAGSGGGTAAATNGTLVLHASFANGLAPGQSEPVSYTADNGSDTDLQVGTVHAVVTTSDPGCLPAWFSIADVTENQTIVHKGSAVPLTSGGSLVFANNAANQDLCKGATITLTLTS